MEKSGTRAPGSSLTQRGRVWVAAAPSGQASSPGGHGPSGLCVPRPGFCTLCTTSLASGDIWVREPGFITSAHCVLCVSWRRRGGAYGSHFRDYEKQGSKSGSDRNVPRASSMEANHAISLMYFPGKEKEEDGSLEI